MKTWYLILYLWNVGGYGNAERGGPALTIVETYNQQLCENLGSQAKKFFDSKLRYEGSKPEATDFRCVELQKAPQMGTDIAERLRVIKENQQYLESLKKQLETK